MPKPPKVPKTVGELPVVIPTDAPKTAPPKIIITDGVPNLPPDTTKAQDLTASSRRGVNLIWETMQAGIAAGVVSTGLYVSSRLALLILVPNASETQTSMANTAFMLIANLASLIIGFYFGRTNHSKVGGVGGEEEKRRGE